MIYPVKFMPMTACPVKSESHLTGAKRISLEPMTNDGAAK